MDRSGKIGIGKSLALAAGVVLGLCALSCNAILGIEESRVLEGDASAGSGGGGDGGNGGGAAGCTGADCQYECGEGRPCPGDQQCVAGRCQSPVLDPDAGEGGVAGDGGDMDGGTDAGTDAGCAQDEIRCEGQAQTYRSACDEGQWVSTESCTKGQLCNSETGECAPIAEGCSGVDPEGFTCIDRDRITCGPDLVTSSRVTCKTVEHCTGSSDGECLPCIEGEYRCQGDELQVCNETQSGFKQVELCNADECNALLGMCTPFVCNPEQYACIIETNTLTLCNADGTDFDSTTDCGDGICDRVGGQCDVCNEGTGTCLDGETRSVCSEDGQELSQDNCAVLTADAQPFCVGSGDCVDCLDPSSECVNASQQRSCQSDNTWGEPETCDQQTCVVDRCTGECSPGTYRCAGEASDQRESCSDDGYWAADPGATCASGSLCDRYAVTPGTCKPIVSGCEGMSPDDAVCSGLTRIVCGPDLVTSSNGDTCSSAALCQLGTGTACAVCTTGQHRCEGAQLYECNDTHTGWDIDGAPCSSAALCNETLGQCTTQVCFANNYYCDVDDNLLHCNPDGTGYVAADTVPCGEGLCDATDPLAGECDVCFVGTYLGCDGNSRIRCDSEGQGTTLEACGGNFPVCIESGDPVTSSCVECVTGDAYCDGQELNTCVDNSWTTDDCTDNGTYGQTCRDLAGGFACIGECTVGVTRCSGNNSELCDATGDFDFVETCPVCIADGDCVECVIDTTKCDGLTAQFICVGYNWGSSVPCVDSTCFGDVGGVGGYCDGDCVANTFQCTSRTQSQRCDSEGVWYDYEVCTADPPEICDEEVGSETYGRCIDNPPVEVGLSGPGDVEYPLSNNLLIAQPILIEEDVTLVAFGIRTTPNSSGGRAYLSLHADEINTAPEPDQHEPTTIINRTGQITLYPDDKNWTYRELGASQYTSLTGGTRYWIVANISESSGSGEDVRIYANTASSPVDGYRSGTRTFALPSSLSFGATGARNGEIGLFIEVQK